MHGSMQAGSERRSVMGRRGGVSEREDVEIHMCATLDAVWSKSSFGTVLRRTSLEAERSTIWTRSCAARSPVGSIRCIRIQVPSSCIKVNPCWCCTLRESECWKSPEDGVDMDVAGGGALDHVGSIVCSADSRRIKPV